MPEDLPHQVVWSSQARLSLEEIAPIVRASGRAEELAQVLRTIDERLRREPLGLGEVYRSRGGVAEHLAVMPLLGIDFAVDTARRFVLVRKCWLVGHSGA